ncbi:M48 family metallopeptidase [Pistricoccus aurantiacus]|uniref:M48 family metallopeptidase n=1 Tax=Pistricoccus aurantiacus TaxID=1883414 RepID=UPI00362689A4
MDFFAAQDNARRSTAWLIALLVLAVAVLVGLTTLAITLALGFSAPGQGWRFDPWLLGKIALSVMAVALIGGLWRSWQLRHGGRAVAESLGGRLLNANVRSPLEERALNLVEEMAIAAGILVPEVYLIEDPAINAFAAGHAPEDAVIGITQGALERLDRDELQGVIAHEFSHILHGDMRLNLRLVGLLHGILLVGLIGRLLFHGGRMSRVRLSRSSNSDTGVKMMLAGGALMVLGYAGTLCANLIKAAVSRQREYLADASAVQFTRNPEGIGHALLRLAGHGHGSQLGAANAVEYSHLFFGPGVHSFSRLTHTHPPLKARIRRVLPNWQGEMAPSRFTQEAVTPPPEPLPPIEMPSKTSIADKPLAVGAAVIASVGQLEQKHLASARQHLEALSQDLVRAAHDPYAARALIYGILMGLDPESRTRQRQVLTDAALPEVLAELNRLDDAITALESHQRLPLLELTLPVLRQLSPEQAQRLDHCLTLLMLQETQPGALQWALLRILRQGMRSGKRQRWNRRLEELAGPATLLLSVLARYNADELAAQEAFTAAVTPLGMTLEYMILDASPEDLDWALQRLVALAPQEQARLLKAMVRCVEQDGVIAPEEMELLRAVSLSLHCPIPLSAGGSLPLQAGAR